MRLDKYVSERFFSSRTKAARAIAGGRVTLNGRVAKASDEVREGDDVRLEPPSDEFVSEGGKKLARALTFFKESAEGAVCADLGASTGGFTDCLLKAGARRVYAADVGESQLAPSLANDPRVTVMDRTNVRYLRAEDFPEQIEIVTVDVSFISLSLVFPAIAGLLAEHGRLIALIKPQFECGAKGLDKHGVVKDAAVRREAVLRAVSAAEGCGLRLCGLVYAPLRPRKNVEYMAYFRKDGAPLSKEEILRRTDELL